MSLFPLIFWVDWTLRFRTLIVWFSFFSFSTLNPLCSNIFHSIQTSWISGASLFCFVLNYKSPVQKKNNNPKAITSNSWFGNSSSFSPEPYIFFGIGLVARKLMKQLVWKTCRHMEHVRSIWILKFLSKRVKFRKHSDDDFNSGSGDWSAYESLTRMSLVFF